MKQINMNKSGILGQAQRGEIKIGEIVFSTINNCGYKITETINEQGHWVGVEEIKAEEGR